MPTQDLACFATVEDLEERTGKTYEGTELTRARSLLLDASVDLVGFGFDPDETDAYRLHIAKQCVCNAVSFKLDRDAASEAVEQITQTAGPYSQTMGFVSASGSLRFLRQDLALLGLGTSRYRSVQAGSDNLGSERWLTGDSHA